LERKWALKNDKRDIKKGHRHKCGCWQPQGIQQKKENREEGGKWSGECVKRDGKKMKAYKVEDGKGKGWERGLVIGKAWAGNSHRIEIAKDCIERGGIPNKRCGWRENGGTPNKRWRW
jgi:hypothetical protein